MPSDVSTPNWRCDLCGTTHGERLDLAERCESSPLPPELPQGTPLLLARNGHYELVPLSPVDKIDTAVNQWNDASGHHRTYSFPGRGGTSTQSDKDLSPALPGYLQIIKSPGSFNIERQSPVRHLPRATLYEAFGLGHADSLIRSAAGISTGTAFSWNSRGTWVKPITPEVRAVFDLLGVHLPIDRWQTDRSRVQGWENYLLHITEGDLSRARALLQTLPLGRVDRTIEDLQRRWLDGEAIQAPWPWLGTRSKLTASRLTKAHRPIIEATGLPWPPRTSASEYVTLLMRNTLMTTTPAKTRAFGTTKIIAVGGVKGGVGKTTTAAALSMALAAAGHRTTLIDLDLDGPTLGVAFELEHGVPVSDDLTSILPVEVAPNLRVFSHTQVASGVLPVRWTDTEVADWVRFLGETIDTSNTDYTVLDLPAGQGPIIDQVLAYNAPAEADVFVAVGSADPYTLPALESSLGLLMHERRARIVVENLGRVVGVDDEGSTVEVRPHGPASVVENLAAKHHCIYGGSLPYAAHWSDLAASDEVKALAKIVADQAAVRGDDD